MRGRPLHLAVIRLFDLTSTNSRQCSVLRLDEPALSVRLISNPRSDQTYWERLVISEKQMEMIGSLTPDKEMLFSRSGMNEDAIALSAQLRRTRKLSSSRGASLIQ